MGFLNKHSLLNCTSDGRNCIILEHLYFADGQGNEFRTELMLRTDGGSIPRPFWSIIPPFGKIWWSFVFHDGLYQNRVEVWHSSGHRWVKFNATESQANDLLFEAMRTQSRNWYEAATVWVALHWCGWRAYDEDRARKCRTSKQ